MASAKLQKTSWADDVDDLDKKDIPQNEEFVDENGIRTTIEYTENEEGKRVKIIRRIKRTLQKSVVEHAVAERQKWAKFGQERGKQPGPDRATTTVGENVTLKLSAGNKQSEQEEQPEAVKVKKMGGGKVVCRLCKGEHFTAKCPYKDTLSGLENVESGFGGPEEDFGTGPDTTPAPAPATNGKYVPPSMRAGARGPGESMRGAGSREDLPTLRVTNISEDTGETDLRELFGKFGRVARVYVGRDRETGIGKGFAFVSFEDKAVAQRAMEVVHGRGYDNLILNVQWSPSLISSAGTMLKSQTTPSFMSSRSQVTLVDESDQTRSPVGSKAGPDAEEQARGGQGGRNIEDGRGQTTVGEDGKPARLGAQFLCVAPILVGVFLSAMDNTIVISSFGAIGTYFNALEKTSWIATAYLLTVSSFQPLYGKLSDIFGRKSCILFAYSIFALGCALCGSAQSMNMLIASRALAGIGGGGMATLASIIISDLVPLRSRGTWQGLMNIVWSCGNTAGSSLGGLLADTIGWRWGFFIQLPLAIASGVSVYFFLKMPNPPASSPATTVSAHEKGPQVQLNRVEQFKAKIRRIDFAGAIVLFCAVFCLLYGMDKGGSLGWQHASTVSALISFAFLIIIFGFIEGFVASEPFAPPRIIFNRGLIPSYLTNFLIVATNFGQLFQISLYFQAVLGKSAAVTGAWLVITIAADLMSSLLCGVIMQSTGRYYYLSTCAYVVMLSGAVTVAGGTGLLRMPKSMGEIIAGLAVTAMGYGGGITTSVVALIANVDQSDQAVATAVSYFFRSLGSVIGLSIGSTLVQIGLQNTLRHTVQGEDADEIARQVRTSLAYFDELDVDTRAIVRSAYATAIANTQILSMALVFAAIVVSLFIIEKRLAH
ncbi:hypothetical protein NP233_g7660 [Leucocoprinus birnbaumii]|uniref:Eukaryotic translation initiation factor 3 subunit G n=1 Tax=Leucocoprinus birnbaumii TaxID=56174 RepID=A0AAD5VNX8_9AGAR|nr:hypothetical protein NP233_g7660 [Leucocoprinus birnbaumii]